MTKTIPQLVYLRQSRVVNKNRVQISEIKNNREHMQISLMGHAQRQKLASSPNKKTDQVPLFSTLRD